MQVLALFKSISQVSNKSIYLSCGKVPKYFGFQSNGRVRAKTECRANSVVWNRNQSGSLWKVTGRCSQTLEHKESGVKATRHFRRTTAWLSSYQWATGGRAQSPATRRSRSLRACQPGTCPLESFVARLSSDRHYASRGWAFSHIHVLSFLLSASMHWRLVVFCIRCWSFVHG